MQFEEPGTPSTADRTIDPERAERRGAPRWVARLPARLGLPSRAGEPGVLSDAEVHDMSASGVRCVTDRPFDLMTQLELVLMLPTPWGTEQPVEMTGAVVRSQAKTQADGSERYETAIFFTGMSVADRSELASFLASLSQAEASDT